MAGHDWESIKETESVSGQGFLRSEAKVPKVTSSTTRGEVRDGSNGATAPSGRLVERHVGLPSGRAVVGGLLMALAAVGTFLAYSNATADDHVDVLVAARQLHVGETLTADDLAVVSIDVDGSVRGLFGSADAAIGRTMVASVAAGEFLQESATTEVVDENSRLELTISLPGNRAVGNLSPGDRVDVFSTWSDTVTELIAVDAVVLAYGGPSGVLATGGDQVVVRLGLADFGQLEALVHAQAAGDITMIRVAPNTTTADVGREYTPRETRSDSVGADAAEADG